MASISQLKTKLQNALNSKLSIGEQSLTEDQKKKTLGNLGIWDRIVDYGNKITDYGSKITNHENIITGYGIKIEELFQKFKNLVLQENTFTGNVSLKESFNILLRPNNGNYTSGIGYDTYRNESVSIWAKNTVTRLRWNAGVDMSSMASGTMMNITPDFEISKADGTAKGYIAGNRILTNNIGTDWYYNTNTNPQPFNISRTGGSAENMAIGLDDATCHFVYTNDETSNNVKFRFINTDTESGGGASKSDHWLNISSSLNGISLSTDTSTIRYVQSSYNSGNRWYRKWSDGWIEQGDYVRVASPTTSTTISFITSFTSKPKCVLITYDLGTHGVNDEYACIVTGAANEDSNPGSSLTTSNFIIQSKYGPRHFMWYACGV